MIIEHVNSAFDIRQMMQRFSDVKAVGFDTETTSLSPHSGKLRLLQFSDGQTVYVLDKFKLREKTKIVNQLLEDFSIIKICHNSKFEHLWVQNELETEMIGVFDTQLAAQLSFNTLDKKQYKLNNVIKKYLGIKISKEEQLSDWSREVLTDSQIHYAATDALHLPALREELIKKLYQDEQIDIAKLEFLVAPVVARIEHNGMPIDQEKYGALCDVIDKDRNKAHDELLYQLNTALGISTEKKIATQFGLFGDDKEIDYSGHINLNSHVQLKKAYSAMGLDLASTANQTIQSLVGEYPELKLLTTYRKAEKLRTTYGRIVLTRVDPITGRLHPQFFQLGAETGRFSCGNPNLQQVPHDDEFRECFRPSDPNKCMIICDYSQIELRILAHLSKDVNMMRAYTDGIDLHSMTAKAAFNLSCTVKEVGIKYPDYRKKAKGLIFGVVYGIMAKKYSIANGITEGEAQAAIDGWHKEYFGASRYLSNIQKTGIGKRHVRTLGGRKIRLRFDPTDKWAVRAAERNCRNSPIQGTSADILKTALIYLDPVIKNTSAKIVNIVHDEVVIECDRGEAKEIASATEQEMKRAAEKFVTAVPIECPADIGESWNDKS